MNIPPRKPKVEAKPPSEFSSERPVLVRHSYSYIELLIYPNGNGYPINHSRMNTAPKVIGWIVHLCGKANVTTEHVRQFIEAAEKLGVKVNRDA